MNNLEKIVLLNWYADENIDFVLNKHQKKFTQEERAGTDYDKVHKKNDLYGIKTVQGLIEYIDQCNISDLKIYSKHTNKTIEEISDALERDNFMTADEAKKFGLIDSVVEKRK